MTGAIYTKQCPAMLANIVIIFSSTKEEEDVKRVEELSSSVCCQMEANAAEWISLIYNQ
jgi:hypothetical protein